MQNRKPMVLVFAGPNGSGKSTITSFFDKVGRYTNADDLFCCLNQYTFLSFSVPFCVLHHQKAS